MNQKRVESPIIKENKQVRGYKVFRHNNLNGKTNIIVENGELGIDNLPFNLHSNFQLSNILSIKY